jgi:peptidoglycan/xylan/chitin deacetylase (PgdA/CDA1 family)
LPWFHKTGSIRAGSRARLVVGAALAAAALLMTGGNGFAWTANSTASPPQTTVTLTFDDGSADQYLGLAALNAHGMNATYYLNSAKINGDSAYLTWSQVADLAAAGNEIAGHTAYHADLTFTDPTEAQRQICYDRTNLLNRGYQVTDFAYPYGDYNPSVEQMVQNCGYNSARTTDTFPSSAPSGQIPPPDPYAIKVGADDTPLPAMEAAVTNAENSGGGWVPIVLHHICAACNHAYITSADFSTFLDWLQGQSGNGVVVKTVQQVIGGSVQPAVPGPPLPPAPNGTNALRNSSLEQDTNGDSIPDCWANDDFGSNSFTWTRTTDAHFGSWAERLDVTNYQNGDNKLLVQTDLGYCMPTVTPGHQYRITEWYKSDSPVYFTLFTRDSQWQIRYWTSSPAFPASSTWTQASFVTDAIPSGINGMMFGLTLGSNGSLTVDDATFDDAAASGGGDTTPPTVSLTSPSAGATLSGFVPISANASDNVAVDHVDYLVDGNLVATLGTGPFTYNWSSRSVANGTHTISVRAVDTAGNKTTTAPITVFVSNQTTNLLQNPSLEQGTSNPPSCWALAGYGTNTYAWTWTSDAHTGTHAENLNISSLTNGDRKLLTSFSSTCSPAVIPGHTYTISVWYKAASPTKPIIFTFGNTTGGNGAYNFFAQSPGLPASTTWTQASWSTPVIPAGFTNLSVGLGLNNLGQVTMDDFAMYDNAPPPDTTPPTSLIACNAGDYENGCATGYYNGPVEVDLSATDDPGGSGVSKIVYTTDGSDPSLTNGTTYTGPFSVSQTRTVKYRAYDKAGNAEAVHSQLIQIDTIPPTASISCNGGPCAGWFNSGVSATLAAADSGGSGVDRIIYTTDGSDPSLTNGNAYVGSFSVNTTTTVKYVAVDKAGNVGTVSSQLIQVDTVAPTSSIQCNSATCTTAPYASGVVVSLSAIDDASGVASIRYTTDGTTPTATTGNVYLSPFTLAATATVRYRAFDVAGNAEPVNSELVTVDTTPPTVSLTAPADGATVSGSTTLSASASDNTAVDHVDFLVDGNKVGTATSAPWGVSWDSTTVADGQHTITAVAYDTVGNSTTSSGHTVTVSNAAPPTSISLSAPADGSTVGGGVTLTASVSGTTPDHVDFLVDGTTVGTATSSPWSITWDSTTVADGQHTISAHAVDGGGNTTASSDPITVTVKNAPVDTTPPTSTISCNSSSCGGWFNAAVSVSLAATDNAGGSGVNKIVYTTDGSTPTTTHGTVYSGAFSVTATTTVKYRAFDNAGNAEAVNSQQIQIDSVAPSSSIQCNGANCGSSFYNVAVAVTLAATDTGGSGVNEIVYTTDGSTPTTTHGTVYSGSFNVGLTTTVKYRAFDNAGNAEPVNSALIQVDTTPPSTIINCNGSPCSASAWYRSGVSVALTATDADSGVSSIRYTTNGTVPTKTTGTLYTSPFTLTTTTTVNYRAFDNAGNSENDNVMQVQVDGTAPTVSLTAPNAGATVAGTTTLSATAGDNVAVDHVDFLVDGNPVGTATSAPWSINWDSTTVADGQHRIAARAVDSAGNTTTSSSVSVITTNFNLLQNPGLEQGTSNPPSCWLLGGYGTNTFTWTWTSDAHTGTHAENLNITSYTNGDRKLLTAFNGTCSIATQAGRSYTITVWYKSTAKPAIFAFISTTGPTGGYSWLGQSPGQPISSGWTQATWTTPPMPANTTNLSVGMGLNTAGSVTMDDFGAFRTG